MNFRCVLCDFGMQRSWIFQRPTRNLSPFKRKKEKKVKMFFILCSVFRFFISFFCANHWNHFLPFFFRCEKQRREYHNVHTTKKEKWYSPSRRAHSKNEKINFHFLNVILILFRFLDVITQNIFQVDISLRLGKIALYLFQTPFYLKSLFIVTLNGKFSF